MSSCGVVVGNREWYKYLPRLFQIAFLYLVDTLARIAWRQSDSKGLLLVRLDAIGDFVIWLDSAKEFRRLYAGFEITLCANSIWVDLARGLPHWDKVLSIDVRRLTEDPIYRFRTLRGLRLSGFDVAIESAFSRVFLEGDAVIRASAASQRIGSVGDLSNINPYLKAISDRWYTRLVMTSPAPLMELERNAEFIRNLSALDFAANRSYLPQLVDLPDRLKISSPYFIVFPGASRIGRRWPVAHFLEVTTQLHLVYGWLPVLCGGTSETLLCQKIADLSTVPMLNLGGATSLPELVELLRGACLLITNETSALHLAAAVSTPTVGIVGGGHFGRFMPYPDSISGIKPIAANHEMSCYGCNWQCSQIHDPAGPVPCIRDVSVKRVLELVSLQNKDSGIIQVAE